MHHPTDRIAHTTAFVTPVVEHWLEREIAQWVRPMKDRSDDPSHHERTLLPRSYISLWRETADQRPVEFTVIKIVNLTLIICQDHVVYCSLLELLTCIHTLSFFNLALYVLSCLWDDAYKRTLAANRKE